MKNNIILLFLLINIIYFYFYKKKKIKKFIFNLFFKSNIKSVSLSEIHPMFLPIQNIDKCKFPKEDVVIKGFVIDKSFEIIGQTSDYEAWILSCFAKISKNIFEFGTASGKTTALFALNSPKNSKVYSITLKPDEVQNINFVKNDNKVASRNALKESVYSNFIFNNLSICNKIELIFGDSRKFDEKKLASQIDLIFIDGGHNYSCVKSDSEKAFSMIKSGGYIFWHDYVITKRSFKDVVKYVHEISKNKNIFHIKDTSLVFYKKK
jgi:predicted O-methyltransferase YrrM